MSDNKLKNLTKEQLIAEVERLREQRDDLKDETQSLWMMLDELTESDIANWSHMLDQLEVKIAQESLVRGMPIDKLVDCDKGDNK